MVSNLIYWVQNTGSEVSLRSRHDRKTAIFCGNAVARRITLGLDQNGLPALGIPFVDKTVWGRLTFQNVIFSWYGKNPVAEDGSICDLDNPVVGDFHLGIVVTDKSGETATLWVPSHSSKLFRSMLMAPIKFSSQPGIIRVVYYDIGAENQIIWIANEDFGVCKISVLRDDPLDVDVMTRAVPPFSTKGREITGIQDVPEAMRQESEVRGRVSSGDGENPKKGEKPKRRQASGGGRIVKSNSPRGLFGKRR